MHKTSWRVRDKLKHHLWLDLVEQTCNPSYWEVFQENHMVKATLYNLQRKEENEVNRVFGIVVFIHLFDMHLVISLIPITAKRNKL